MKTRLHPRSEKIPARNESPADRAFSEQADLKLYETLFWSTFKDLPKQCRQVLLMHWRDFNHQEISRELKTSETRAKEETCACTLEFVEKVKQHKDYKLLDYCHKVR